MATAVSRSWRNLAAFWVLLSVCAAAGAGVLQVLGPVPVAAPDTAPSPGRALAAAEPAVPAPVAPAPVVAAPPMAAPPMAAPPLAAPAPVEPPPAPQMADARPPAAPILDPQPGLLEPAPDFPGKSLPRIGRLPGGAPSSPMKAYAGGIDPHDARPRVALLLAGMGVSGADSESAVTRTPAGVTLAYSPYAVAPDLAQARARGHEIVLSIPMEPAGYPLEDEGPQALLTSVSGSENARRLEWTLSRIEGYAGTTAALGGLRGERFTHSDQQMGRVMSELTTRGLYYVDPRVGGAAPGATTLAVNMVVDETELAQSIETSLDALTRLAVDRGTALGLAGTPRPVTVERIAAWAGRLAGHGVALVPVSALLGSGGLANR